MKKIGPLSCPRYHNKSKNLAGSTSHGLHYNTLDKASVIR